MHRLELEFAWCGEGLHETAHYCASTDLTFSDDNIYVNSHCVEIENEKDLVCRRGIFGYCPNNSQYWRLSHCSKLHWELNKNGIGLRETPNDNCICSSETTFRIFCFCPSHSRLVPSWKNKIAWDLCPETKTWKACNLDPSWKQTVFPLELTFVMLKRVNILVCVIIRLIPVHLPYPLKSMRRFVVPPRQD